MPKKEVGTDPRRFWHALRYLRRGKALTLEVSSLEFAP